MQERFAKSVACGGSLEKVDLVVRHELVPGVANCGVMSVLATFRRLPRASATTPKLQAVLKKQPTVGHVE